MGLPSHHRSAARALTVMTGCCATIVHSRFPMSSMGLSNCLNLLPVSSSSVMKGAPVTLLANSRSCLGAPSLRRRTSCCPPSNQEVAFASKFRSRQKLRYQCQNLAFLQVLEVSKHNQKRKELLQNEKAAFHQKNERNFFKKCEIASEEAQKRGQRHMAKPYMGTAAMAKPHHLCSLWTWTSCSQLFSPITPWLRRRPISCTHLLCSATWPA